MKKAAIFLGFVLGVISGCASLDYSKESDYLLDNAYDRIIEEGNVKATVETLFISTDSRHWSAVKGVFADKVHFDMTSLVGGDPVTLTSQEIVDAWDKGLKPLKAIHHQTGNYQITVKDNEADVFCYGIAFHYLPNKTKRNTRTFVGSYNFHLVRQGGDWKIDRFKFNLKFVGGNLKLESS